MQTKSWIAQSKMDREVAMRALTDAGFKSWRGPGNYAFAVEAHPDDHDRVELIVRDHAPGSRTNRAWA